MGTEGKAGTVGRIRERTLLVWAALSATALLVVYLPTESDILQFLACLAAVAVFRWLQRRAAVGAPIPPYPDPPPRLRPTWQRVGAWLLLGAALGAALGELAYRAGGGFAFWFFVGFLAPLSFVVNRHGVTERPRPRRWRKLLAAPPRSQHRAIGAARAPGFYRLARLPRGRGGA